MSEDESEAESSNAEVMPQKSEDESETESSNAEVMPQKSEDESEAESSNAEVMPQKSDDENGTESCHAKVSSLTFNGILNGQLTSSIVINGANCNMTVTDILDMMRLVRETQDSTPQESSKEDLPRVENGNSKEDLPRVENGNSKEDLPRVENGTSKEDNCLPRVEDGTTLRVSGVFKGVILNGVKLTIIPDKVEEPQKIVRKKRAVEDVDDGEQSSKRLKEEDNV